MICHRRPIIVHTDEPVKNQFYHDIWMIYILSSTAILVLGRIDEKSHQPLIYTKTLIQYQYHKVHSSQKQ